jgi:hypothetical protein
MKRMIFIIMPMLLLFNELSNAQSLSEKLGAIHTNFKFYYDTVDLNVSDQFIIKNVGSYFFSTDNKVAYESYHLEFVSNKRLLLDYSQGLFKVHYYTIVFYSSDKLQLFRISISQEFLNIATNLDISESPIFYSLDLFDIPLSLLDRTSKIVIVQNK